MSGVQEDLSDGPSARMLPRAFFQRDPVTCARELVGCELLWGASGGVIVETEAYTATGDEAAHTFSRPSARAFVQTQSAGTAYVYLNYGRYWLCNVLVKGGTRDGFVLIRALQPTRGIKAMQRRRFPQSLIDQRSKPLHALCSGPGKLTIALGITGQHHGMDLCRSARRSFHGPSEPGLQRRHDLRIGITRSAHLPWRFLAADSEFVSVKATLGARDC